MALIRGALEHEVGVTLRSKDGELRTVACSDPAVEKCDQLQARYPDGPFASLDQLTVSNDLATDRRWPTWGPGRGQPRLPQSLGGPARQRRQQLGVLDALLSLPAGVRSPGRRCTRDPGAAGRRVSEHRAPCLPLREAIEGRTVIGQAQGILMERCDISAPEAFEVLRRYPGDTNTKLRDIAVRLIETGGLGVYVVGREAE